MRSQQAWLNDRFGCRCQNSRAESCFCNQLQRPLRARLALKPTIVRDIPRPISSCCSLPRGGNRQLSPRPPTQTLWCSWGRNSWGRTGRGRRGFACCRGTYRTPASVSWRTGALDLLRYCEACISAFVRSSPRSPCLLAELTSRWRRGSCRTNTPCSDTQGRPVRLLRSDLIHRWPRGYQSPVSIDIPSLGTDVLVEDQDSVEVGCAGVEGLSPLWSVECRQDES
jgi:hypothetical protein